MDIKSYLDKIEIIRKNELITQMELSDQLGISWNTLKRIREKPEICALRTMRKLKAFVDIREDKYGRNGSD